MKRCALITREKMATANVNGVRLFYEMYVLRLNLTDDDKVLVVLRAVKSRRKEARRDDNSG